MAVPDEGFKVNVGGHLIEDPGSGLTKVFEHVGKELVHGTVSAEMPVWDHEKGAWGSVRDRYSGSRTELKKVIKALIETPYSELDRWDDRNLRQWLHQYTNDQGVIDLFEFITVLECMTDQWWDHSASDNLFVRKMHFSERGTAAYSCWPGQGWDGMWADLADAITSRGGELRLGTQVERVVIENHEVKGVAVARQPRVLPNEFFEEELIEAPCVISTLPVWHVLKVVAPKTSCRTGTPGRSGTWPRTSGRSPGWGCTWPPRSRCPVRPARAVHLAAHAGHGHARVHVQPDRDGPVLLPARNLPARDGRGDPR